MKELTKCEIISKYKKEIAPFSVKLVGYILGLLSGVLPPACILVLAIATQSLQIVVVGLPIVLLIGCFCLEIFMLSHIREARAIKRGKYRIIRAKCTDVKYKEASGDDTGYYLYCYETDDKTFELVDKGGSKGEYSYLIVLGDSTIMVFKASEYYTNDYQTTFYNSEYTREIKERNKSKNLTRHICYATFFLFEAVLLDVGACIDKDWILALFSGLFFVFSLLIALIKGVRRYIIKPIFVTYLFVNGGLFFCLSYMYNHSTVAYIVGSVYVLISLICSVIWIRGSKK